jgi:hypothetical protein|tara:strand:- start:80 stop:325 length:246 start_codon:yes stop_codon:yes gene_type:complete
MRTPDKIRDASMERFNELAADKFDKGQKEHSSCLDDTVNFDSLEEELIDLWHYTQSLKHQYNTKLDALQKKVERWEEIAKR